MMVQWEKMGHYKIVQLGTTLLFSLEKAKPRHSWLVKPDMMQKTFHFPLWFQAYFLSHSSLVQLAPGDAGEVATGGSAQLGLALLLICKYRFLLFFTPRNQNASREHHGEVIVFFFCVWLCSTYASQGVFTRHCVGKNRQSGLSTTWVENQGNRLDLFNPLATTRVQDRYQLRRKEGRAQLPHWSLKFSTCRLVSHTDPSALVSGNAGG